MTTWQDLEATTKDRARLREIVEQAGSGSVPGLSMDLAGAGAAARAAAAEAVASASGLALYRIDLGAVVSKYIGETEKNLERIFDAAETRPAVLFFDEAEALFGQRSEIKDSHDRYANSAVNYLLQRIERYRGLVILGVRRAIVAAALLRRVRCVLELPPSCAEAKRYVPDLATAVDQAVLSIALRAIEVLYFAAMLEEFGAFQAVDRLVELFRTGLLPLGTTRAANRLSAYAQQSRNRWSQAERRDLYQRVFGLPGGQDEATPNRDFAELYLRFVSSVSSLARQACVGTGPLHPRPTQAEDEALREAARDLAVNLSLHGYGISLHAATELGEQVCDVLAILADPDVLAAYGARDLWQVVDAVASLELGGARNAAGYTTLAASGGVVIAWLAQHLTVLWSRKAHPVLHERAVPAACHPQLHAGALSNPTDDDLIIACALGLAVTGDEENQVGAEAQPRQSPTRQGLPVELPALARDMLSAIGVAGESASSPARAGHDVAQNDRHHQEEPQGGFECR